MFADLFRIYDLFYFFLRRGSIVRLALSYETNFKLVSIVVVSFLHSFSYFLITDRLSSQVLVTTDLFLYEYISSNTLAYLLRFYLIHSDMVYFLILEGVG